MKKIYLLVLIAFSFSHCMYMGNFGKRPIYLVGAPDDIQVMNNGKKVDVKLMKVADLITSPERGGVRVRTEYRHPAAMVKVRRTNRLELTANGKSAKVEVKGKTAKGILFLVLEAPITLGIGTIVDLATVSFFHPATKYIDVKAAFNNTSPKDKKELYKMALENSSKEIITEMRTR